MTSFGFGLGFDSENFYVCHFNENEKWVMMIVWVMG